VNATELDPTADRPLSSQLADLLRDEILGGVRRPGSQLPTESGFQTDYGVSRTTVRTALRELIGQGLVVSRKGYGSYVRDQRPIRRVSAGHRAGSNKPLFDTAIEAQGHVPSRRILKVGRTTLPHEIAELLALPRGSEAVVRQRLHLVDSEPASIATSYYPLWLAEGTALESIEAIPQGPDALIESLGIEFGKCTEVFRARMPLTEEARTLRLDPGVPVIRVLRTDFEKSGQPLQVADDLYAGDRHEIAVTWEDELEEGRS
jgi:GntR family transcriptional regulator